MIHNASLVHATEGGDKLIAYMARVSNPANQDNEKIVGLIKYLIKHKHWSPFEMVNMCVEINTTRSISAQILRHRSFSFQEFSQPLPYTGEGKGGPCPYEEVVVFQTTLPLLYTYLILISPIPLKIQRIFGYTYYIYVNV